MSVNVLCVIPALNAATSLAHVIQGIRREVPSIRVLGVDDGSADDTRAIMHASCDTVLTFDQNQGKGAALRAAFAYAVAQNVDGVLTMDADGQHDPAVAPHLIHAMQHADIVIGARQLDTPSVPWHRRLANRASTAAARAVTKYPLRDSQSGYRAIRIPVLRHVQARGNRYEFETDFLVRAAHAGFSIREIPIPTIYGPASHFRKWEDGWRIGWRLWTYWPALFRPFPTPHEDSVQ